MRTEKNKWKKGDTAQQPKLLVVSENVLIDSLSFVNQANEKSRVTDDETVVNYGDDAHGDTSVCSFLDRLSTASHFISCLIAVICLGKGTWFELNSHQCANDSLPLSSVNRANHRTKLVYPHDDDDDVPERNEINTHRQAGRQGQGILIVCDSSLPMISFVWLENMKSLTRLISWNIPLSCCLWSRAKRRHMTCSFRSSEEREDVRIYSNKPCE